MSLEHFVRLLESRKNAMGLCTTQCKMLLFCVKTIVIESFNSELAQPKKGGGGGRFGCLATFWFDISQCFILALGMQFFMKTLKDECNKGLQVYEILSCIIT